MKYSYITSRFISNLISKLDFIRLNRFKNYILIL